MSLLLQLLSSLFVHALLMPPIFLLLRWALGKRAFFKKHRAWWALGGTAILYPVVLYGLILGFFAFVGQVPQQDFQQEKWLANETERFQMKDDLIESKVLEGKSKQEVMQLLGRGGYYIQPVWHYTMGGSPAGFGARIYTLRVEFEQDRVSKVSVVETLN